MDSLKGAKKSVVIWFNGLCIAAMPIFEYAVQSLPELREYIPDNIYRSMGAFVVSVNIILRFKTTTALKDKVQQAGGSSGTDNP